MTRLNFTTRQVLASMILGGLIASTVAITPAEAFWPFSKKKKNQDVTEQQTSEQTEDASSAEAAPADEPVATETIPQPYVEPEPTVKLVSPLSGSDIAVDDPVNSSDAPPQKVYVTVDDPKNPLGITTSAETLDQIGKLIEAKKYAEAKAKLDPLLSWLVDSTEAHIALNKTLTKIPSARVQAELEKQLALQFALLRDKAFFSKALVAVGEKNNGEAVKNLSKVVQSQPRGQMGLKAYEMLQKMGFTEKIQVQEATNN